MSQTQSHSSRKILVILALSLFIIALILVIVSSVTPGSKRSLANGGNTFADGYNAARDQAASTGFPGIKNPVTSFTGRVLEVKNDTITISTMLFVHEKVDGVGTQRVVTLDKDGKITLRSPIASEKLAAAMKLYQEKLQRVDPADPATMIAPPPMYEDKEITFSDVKVGDTVMAQGNGEDLRLRESLSAKSIVVFQNLAPTIPTPPQN